MRHQGNKVADKLVNLKKETHQVVQVNYWDMIVDKMRWDSCMNLMFQDMKGTNGTHREGYGTV